MNQSQIIELQRRIDTAPDGYWGPKSIAACQRHLKALMPIGGVWPSPEDGAMVRFFGRPGDESRLVSLVATGPINMDTPPDLITLLVRSCCGGVHNVKRCHPHGGEEKGKA